MLNKGIGESSLTRVLELIEEKVIYLKKQIEGKANSSHKHSPSDIEGNINATTLAGYGLRIVTDETDPGKTGHITIII